jgi:chromate reductase
MAMSADKVKLLGIVGSLRRASYSHAVLEAIRDRVAPEVEIAIHDLAPVPMYNAELDGEDKPAAVVALKQAIAEANGLVISSPEYNYSVPGVLKNAIDWASRPAFKSVMTGKPAVVMTVSTAFTGGVRAQAHLKQVMLACLVDLLPHPDLVFARAGELFEDGRLKDPAVIDVACNAVRALAARIRG